MKNIRVIQDNLDILYKNPKCPLNYNKDYELLISVMLSAQTTDKRVNEVTKHLYKYNLREISKLDINILENILRPLGTYKRKAMYTKEIALRLINDYNGIVPKSREYIENLPGVGHKTCNVVFQEYFNEPAFAVDTHITRVSKRLGLAAQKDDVNKIESKLMKKFPKKTWNKTHLQLLYFGRNICTAKNPKCNICPFKDICKEKRY